MKKGFFDRRIPTVFALLILIGGLGITTLLIQQGTFTTSTASPQEEPVNVTVVNVTNDSFTVMYTTASPTVGAISIENSTPPQLIYDKRDSSGQKEFVSHFITATRLDPDTTYTFNVISNGDLYLDQGKPYTVTTLPATAQKASDSFPLAGSILMPDASPGSDVLIFVNIPEGMSIGAVTDSQGNFRISSNYIRNNKTLEPLAIPPQTKLTIEAQKTNAESMTSYEYIPGQLIPPITLTQNYTFVADVTDITTDTSTLIALPTAITGSKALEITLPQRDQKFTDSRPQFRGTSTPSSTVNITISDTQNIEAQVLSDRNGNWAFRPSTAILPGEHTITIRSKNSAGITQSVSTTFQVFPSGSQVAESATPSATITATKIPTPTIIVTNPPSITNSPTPTVISLTITPIASVTATLTPFSTPTVIQSSISPVVPPKGNIPPTGNSTTAIILTTLSILFIVTGSAFLFIL